MMTWLLAVAAAAVALWPTGKKAAPSAYVPSTLEIDPPKRATTYLDAVACLQKVRQRLTHTNHLEADQTEALDVLTLALSAGSDVEE
jgi:hypothetical protein